MSYKVVRITNLYNEFISQYYEAFPEIKNVSYREQQNHLTRHSVDTVSSFTSSLINMGVDAHSIFTNATPLQNQWKAENNSEKIGKNLIADQIKSLKPQIVWLDDITLIDRKFISFVRESVPSVKLFTGHLCAPYNAENLRNLKALDFLVTCTPCLKSEFEQHGIETLLLYHGFDESVLKWSLVDNQFPETEFLFTGSMYLGGGFHKTRVEYIERFLDAQLPIRIYGSLDPPLKAYSKKIASLSIGALKRVGASTAVKHIPFLRHYEAFGEHSIKLYTRKLRDSMKPPVYGLDQFKLLTKAKLCFNIHGEIAKGCAGNARLFESTGVGTCLVTDWKSNLSDLFDTDKEVVSYRTIDECLDKVKWLLDNPNEVRKIGLAGQARTLKDHTVKKRVQQIHDLFIHKMKK